MHRRLRRASALALAAVLTLLCSFAAAQPGCNPTASPNPATVGQTVGLSPNCTGNYSSFAWSGPSGAAQPTPATAQNPSVTPTQPGSFTYSVFASGQSASTIGTVTLTVVPVPSPPSCTINGVPASPVAPGTQVTLTASCTNNPTSYQWSTGATTQAITVAPGQSTTYTVVATNAGGTSPLVRATVSVQDAQQAPVCTITGAPGAPVAPGTSVTLTASCTGNPTSYRWSTGATTPSITVAPAQTTTYDVSATNASGTSAAATATINVTNAPAAIRLQSGQGQVTTAGQTLPQDFVVLVTSATGQPVAGATVDWAVETGTSGTFAPPSSSTDAQGLARSRFTAGAQPSSRVLRACITGTSTCVRFTIASAELDVIGPAADITGALAQLGLTSVETQVFNIRQRLELLRQQRSPAALDALRVRVDGNAVPLAFAGKGSGASADGIDEPFRVFVVGDVDVGTREATAQRSGFDLRSNGVTLGADYRLNRSWVVGASAGYVDAKADLDNARGRQDATGYSLSLFGQWQAEHGPYANAIVTWGRNDYDSRRAVGVEEARASMNGDQVGAALTAGYDIAMGKLTLTPYARIEHYRVSVDAFTETGTANALSVSELKVRSTIWTVAGQASYAVSMPWGVLLPFGRLELQHQSEAHTDDLSAQLAGVSGVFSVPGIAQDRNFGNFAIGTSAVFARGVSGFFSYEHVFSNDQYRLNRYTLGVNIAF